MEIKPEVSLEYNLNRQRRGKCPGGRREDLNRKQKRRKERVSGCALKGGVNYPEASRAPVRFSTGGEGRKGKAELHVTRPTDVSSCIHSYQAYPGILTGLPSSVSQKVVFIGHLLPFQPLEMHILKETWLSISFNYWRNPFATMYIRHDCSSIIQNFFLPLLDCLPFTPLPRAMKPARSGGLQEAEVSGLQTTGD